MSIAGLTVRCNLFYSLYGFVLLMACTCAIKLIWHLQMNGDIVCVFTLHNNIFECVCTVWVQMQYCLNRIGLFEHWCLVKCVNCNKTTTNKKSMKGSWCSDWCWMCLHLINQQMWCTCDILHINLYTLDANVAQMWSLRAWTQIVANCLAI